MGQLQTFYLYEFYARFSVRLLEGGADQEDADTIINDGSGNETMRTYAKGKFARQKASFFSRFSPCLMSEHISWSRLHPEELMLYPFNDVETVIPVPSEVISPCHGNHHKRLYPVAGAYFALPVRSAPLITRTGF